jgi:hypothetical protein
MTPRLEEKLYKDFPDLYRNRVLPESISRMCDGFCCGDGWFHIIYTLSEKIAKICDDHHIRDDLYPAAFQVKEKYGGLRYYIDTHPKTPKHIFMAIRDAIHDAEMLSEVTCDVCGEKGRVVEVRHWIYTRCDKHIPSE